MTNGNGNGKFFYGTGVVTEYNPNYSSILAKRIEIGSGKGLIHRYDVNCGKEPTECLDKEHFVGFTVYESQWVGVPDVGDELHYTAAPAIQKGGFAVAYQLRRPRKKQTEDLKNVTIPAYGK